MTQFFKFNTNYITEILLLMRVHYKGVKIHNYVLDN